MLGVCGLYGLGFAVGRFGVLAVAMCFCRWCCLCFALTGFGCLVGLCVLVLELWFSVVFVCLHLPTGWMLDMFLLLLGLAF